MWVTCSMPSVQEGGSLAGKVSLVRQKSCLLHGFAKKVVLVDGFFR